MGSQGENGILREELQENKKRRIDTRDDEPTNNVVAGMSTCIRYKTGKF